MNALKSIKRLMGFREKQAAKGLYIKQLEIQQKLIDSYSSLYKAQTEAFDDLMKRGMSMTLTPEEQKVYEYLKANQADQKVALRTAQDYLTSDWHLADHMDKVPLAKLGMELRSQEVIEVRMRISKSLETSRRQVDEVLIQYRKGKAFATVWANTGLAIAVFAATSLAVFSTLQLASDMAGLNRLSLVALVVSFCSSLVGFSIATIANNRVEKDLEILKTASSEVEKELNTVARLLNYA